jgi:pimeloyl-ACP methyl ester carboxylesterase
MNLWHKILALAAVLLFISGCAKPEPVLVVTVGGLGFSQMGDLRHAVIAQCPQAKVISAGAWDAYKTDIKALATAKPHEHIILIGHSLGCPAIAQTAAELPRVDLAVFIDPAWDDFRLPRSVVNYLWYQRSGFGLERESRIVGAARTSRIPGGHNEIPHAPELIEGVVEAINRIQTTTGAPAEAGHRSKPTRGGRPLAAANRDGDNGS